VAGPVIRTNHRRLGISLERLGQAQQPSTGHRKFHRLGNPFPHFFTPLTSGIEFFGGLFLLLGLFTRISAGALAVTMIVAIKAAKWSDVDSLETLLGFDEFEYLALFLWLAIAGPGVVSLDHLLLRTTRRPAAT
jgi:putative oxidoreductase